MKTLIKIIFLTTGFWLSGSLCVKSQSDTICLTDREYNDLLIKSSCQDIIKADSTLLYDRSETISALYEKVTLQDELLKDKIKEVDLIDTVNKKSKRQVLKWKFFTFGIG